jgi:hypothetical protein
MMHKAIRRRGDVPAGLDGVAGSGASAAAFQTNLTGQPPPPQWAQPLSQPQL